MLICLALLASPLLPRAEAALVGNPEVVAGGLEIPWEVVLLPDGRTLVTERTTQRVLVDVRGQTAPPEVLDALAERIAKRSGGHVAVEDIVFRR